MTDNTEISLGLHMTSEQQQSEKEVLAIQKLRQDLRHGKIRLYLTILGSTFVLIGLVVERTKALEQRKVESTIRDRELRLNVFTQRKEAYLALTDAACAVAACRTYEEVEKASTEFNKLYYGRAHIIAEGDSKVKDAKIAFHTALVKYLADKPSISPESCFAGLAMDVTFACKPNIDPRSLN